MARDDEGFLSRWSRRKGEARSAPPAPPAANAPPAAAAAAVPPLAEGQAPPAPPPPLPPIESLTADSDFSPFMRPDVDAALRRAALKKLLHDPRFNVMDGLDVYIDDYSKPDPLPPEWVAKLNQVARLGDYRPPEGEGADAAGEGAATLPSAAAAQPADTAPAPAEGAKSDGDEDRSAGAPPGAAASGSPAEAETNPDP